MNKNYNLQLQSSKSCGIITTEANGFADNASNLNKIIYVRENLAEEYGVSASCTDPKIKI